MNRRRKPMAQSMRELKEQEARQKQELNTEVKEGATEEWPKKSKKTEEAKGVAKDTDVVAAKDDCEEKKKNNEILEEADNVIQDKEYNNQRLKTLKSALTASGINPEDIETLGMEPDEALMLELVSVCTGIPTEEVTCRIGEELMDKFAELKEMIHGAAKKARKARGLEIPRVVNGDEVGKQFYSFQTIGGTKKTRIIDPEPLGLSDKPDQYFILGKDGEPLEISNSGVAGDLLVEICDAVMNSATNLGLDLKVFKSEGDGSIVIGGLKNFFRNAPLNEVGKIVLIRDGYREETDFSALEYGGELKFGRFLMRIVKDYAHAKLLERAVVRATIETADGQLRFYAYDGALSEALKLREAEGVLCGKMRADGSSCSWGQ